MKTILYKVEIRDLLLLFQSKIYRRSYKKVIIVKQ